jgi:predicted nucleic acid-binding protein
MATVYIETSIVSYLRQRPSSQVVMAARQLLTHKWWNEERGNYELVTSQHVLDEASAGDPVLAAERLQSLDGIPLLPLDAQIDVIANEIVSRAILPPKASLDALHIAAAAHHKIQYLLTWNCKHIANARILPRIHKVLTDLGCPIPIICTPEEMVDYDSKDNESRYDY